MADIKDMSREEIERYLANMQENMTEPSVKQKVSAAETMRGADGSYDMSKMNLNKIFVNKANERGNISNNKGSKWQAKVDELPEDVRDYIYQRLNDYKSRGRPLNKWDLREIEHSAKAKFSLPKSFDISSGAMLDSTMAKILNSINTTKTKQPAQSTQSVQSAQSTKQKDSSSNDELNAAFKRIKNKQASDADLALFSRYSEEQLKKMGFGPISIAEIKKTKQPAQSTQSAAKALTEDNHKTRLYKKLRGNKR